MHRNRLARLAALAAASLISLGLCFGCLAGMAQAQAAQARGPAGPAVATTWFVDNTPGDGLVGYWKFDQVFDGSTINSVFFADPTVLTNGASITTSLAASLTVPNFGSLLLDGVNDAVVANDVPNLDVAPSAFSVAAWVRRVYTGTHTADLIYDSGTQSGHWFFGFLNNDKLAFTVNAVKDYTSTLQVTNSSWHHVAAVVNGSGANNLVLYLDGVASPAISAVITTTPSGQKLIGNKNGSFNTPFSGQIDDLRLYNRALSAAEVARLAVGSGCVTDGSSWPGAFQDLQCALVTARQGDQVWIANGTYRPGSSSEATFSLPAGVDLFGGFVGTETSPAQRPAFNPLAVPTALSGDLAGNDQTLTFGNYAENACNVVRAGNPALPGSVSASLDGLTIQAGNAETIAGCGIFPTAAKGGGLWAIGPSQLTLTHVVFRFNRASEAGGGLSNDFGQLIISGGRFFNNTADGNSGFPIGGGLATAGGNLTITASSFESNTAFQGGAIDLRPTGGHSSLIVHGSTFTTNIARDGGAVEDQVGAGVLDLSFDQVTFSNNLATDADGGAMENSGFSGGLVRTHLHLATFTGNRSDEDGGAIADAGEQLTVDASHFNSNTGTGAGGALEIDGVLTLTNSSFVSNTAPTGGGLAVIGTLNLSGSNFSHNHAFNPFPGSDFTLAGGGAFVEGTAAVTNTQFFNNNAFLSNSVFIDANLAGGGGLAVNGNLTLAGSDFRGNSARQGGGVDVIGSAGIQDSLFQDNVAGEGGGVYLDAGSLALLTSQLINNTATLTDSTNRPGRGGGVFLDVDSVNSQIANNLFLGNEALSSSFTPSGAALSLSAQTALVSNNTIVSHNLITISAVSLVTGSAGLFNNIITSHSLALENQGGLFLLEDYNLFHGNTFTASGMISSPGHSRTADPLFVAPALDDFRLQTTSPAIDAGENSKVPAGITTDLAGRPRFIDVPAAPDTGAGPRPIVDIGAFEVGDRLLLPVVLRP